jgi:hypothetical protein
VENTNPGIDPFNADIFQKVIGNIGKREMAERSVMSDISFDGAEMQGFPACPGRRLMFDS